MNILQQKNSNKQGDVGLASAMAWFSKRGCTIALPMTDSQHYDLLVDMGSGAARVQIKTTAFSRKKNGIFSVDIRSKGSPVNLGSLDYFFIVTSSEDMYLIPAGEIECRTEITLNENMHKYIVVCGGIDLNNSVIN